MGDTGDHGKTNAPTEVYRIRRSEVFGLGTLALLTFVWNYSHTTQVDTERKIVSVRSELHADILNAKSDLRRELDACCKRGK